MDVSDHLVSVPKGGSVDLELAGKTAIVTGGSRGIGKAIAGQLALEGVDVAIVARQQERLQATASELGERTGRRIIPISADTGITTSVVAAVETAVDAFGRLDILVNCAAIPGGSIPPTLDAITDEMFWDDVNVKVMGYLRMARAVAPHMIRGGWGRIVNLSGLAARSTGSAIGSMRNVAVVAMTKNLAEELGPRGINVTVVHPGRVRTEGVQQLMAEQAQRQGRTVEEVERSFADNSAIRRLVEPDEIAYVVAFLASPKAVAINGDVIAAGGGVGRAIYY